MRYSIIKKDEFVKNYTLAGRGRFVKEKLFEYEKAYLKMLEKFSSKEELDAYVYANHEEMDNIEEYMVFGMDKHGKISIRNENHTIPALPTQEEINVIAKKQSFAEFCKEKETSGHAATTLLFDYIHLVNKSTSITNTQYDDINALIHKHDLNKHAEEYSGTLVPKKMILEYFYKLPIENSEYSNEVCLKHILYDLGGNLRQKNLTEMNIDIPLDKLYELEKSGFVEIKNGEIRPTEKAFKALDIDFASEIDRWTSKNNEKHQTQTQGL